MYSIDETARVDKLAQIEEGVSIGPYTIIEGPVKIGKNTLVYGHSYICGDTSIGEECHIFPFTSIGMPPQSRSYHGEPAKVIIGDRVVLRENVTIHRGTKDGRGETSVGDDSLLMVGCHIAHDCFVGKNVQMANLVALTGHVHLGNGVVCGGDTGFAPFVRIGDYSFVTASSKVRCHSPPYALIFPEYRGEGLLRSPNYIGMERLGLSRQTISSVKKAFHILFSGSGTYRDNIKKLGELNEIKEIQEIILFLDQCPIKVNTMRLLTKYRRPSDEIQ